MLEDAKSGDAHAVGTTRARESGYPATPCDCLISELREALEAGYLTLPHFEERVKQWRGEVEWGVRRFVIEPDCVLCHGTGWFAVVHKLRPCPNCSGLEG